MAQGDAEVILDFGIFRVNGGGAAQGVERLVVFFLAEFQIAECGKIVGIVGALNDGGLDVFLRVGQFVLLQLDGREVRQREAVVLVAVENLLVVRFRLIKFVPGEMLLRGGDEFGGTGGQFVDGFSDRLNLARLRHGLAEQRQFLRRVGNRLRLVHGQPRAQRFHLVIERGDLGGDGVVFAAGIFSAHRVELRHQFIALLRKAADARLKGGDVRLRGIRKLRELVFQRQFFERGHGGGGFQGQNLGAGRLQFSRQLVHFWRIRRRRVQRRNLVPQLQIFRAQRGERIQIPGGLQTLPQFFIFHHELFRAGLFLQKFPFEFRQILPRLIDGIGVRDDDFFRHRDGRRGPAGFQQIVFLHQLADLLLRGGEFARVNRRRLRRERLLEPGLECFIFRLLRL